MIRKDFVLDIKDNSWFMKIPFKLVIRCKSCYKKIFDEEIFYFCSDVNKFWCFNCRNEKWGNCSLINHHQKFCIRSVERESEEKTN